MLPSSVKPQQRPLTQIKNDKDIFYSPWKNTGLGKRQQVRIRVGEAGELYIQHVAQGIFSRIASSLLPSKAKNCKTLSAVVVKKFFNARNLPYPLSLQQKKAVLVRQYDKLSAAFKTLSDSYDGEISKLERKKTEFPEPMQQEIQQMIDDTASFAQILNQHLRKPSLYESSYQLLCSLKKKLPALSGAHEIALKSLNEKVRSEAIKPIETPPQELPKPEPEPDTIPTPISESKIEPASVEVQPPPVNPLPAVEEIKLPEIPLKLPERPWEIFKHQYEAVYQEAEALLADLKKRFQLSNANKLEECLANEKSFLQLTPNILEPIDSEEKTIISALKSSKERIEDCMDNLEEVSFIHQILALPENDPRETILKEALIKETRKNIATFCTQLDLIEKDFSELVKATSESIWHHTIYLFFAKVKKQMRELSEIFYYKEGVIIANHHRVPVNQLKRQELFPYVNTIEALSSEALHFLNEDLSIPHLQETLLDYQTLFKEIQDKLKELESKGEYLHLHRLKEDFTRESANVDKGATSIHSQSQWNNYISALERGISIFKERLSKIENEGSIDPIEQLNQLKSLNRQFYEKLHLRYRTTIVNHLDNYLYRLKNNYSMLDTVIASLSNQHADVSALNKILQKVKSQISIGTSLSTHFSIRKYFWQLFASPVPLNEIEPNQLNEYTLTVTDFIEKTEVELRQSAAKAGFQFG